MSVAKVIEVISKSKVSFDDAVVQGVTRASESVSGVASAWIKDQSVSVANGKIAEYSVTMKVTFVLKPSEKAKPKGKK